MADDISRVYDRVTGNAQGTHTDVLEQFVRDYHPSHEDFADWCAEYLEKQEPGFKLNFFVDEVGQFIGANDDLLFSLRNVAELLNSRCHGWAWVIVVSQENVEDIIGDFRTRGSAKDFTKIQARFKVKIKIPSNDANAVVRDALAYGGFMKRAKGYALSKCSLDEVGTDALASNACLPDVERVIISRLLAEAEAGADVREAVRQMMAQRTGFASFERMRGGVPRHSGRLRGTCPLAGLR